MTRLMRVFLPGLVLLAALSGCGLGATGTAGAAGAQAQAEAAQAGSSGERVRQQVEAADEAAQQQRADAQRQAE